MCIAHPAEGPAPVDVASMSAEASIPSFTSLTNFMRTVYETSSPEVQERYATLIADYVEKYGSSPIVIARSPGRVNLIGEHIDYEGYSVLPMAISQDTIVAIGRAESAEVHVSNVHSKHAASSFGVDPQLAVDMHNHSWTNYVQAAYKGVFEHLQKHHPDLLPQPVGLNLVVDGQVPQGSGLSSSAALVCSTALAILGVHGVALKQGEVAAFTAACEKYVGTESGGMDQAISIMGAKGLAKLVHFKPALSTEDVPLPAGATFVIANSLAVSAKAETAARYYNMRVVECRLATALLALKLGLSQEEALSRTTLREVEGMLRKHATGDLAGTIEKLLPEPLYSQEAVERLLGTPLETVFAGNASQLKCLAVAAENGGFKLQQRAVHVYAEAARVPEFKAVCDSSAPAEEKVAALGRLMDASQASCRDLYECSCEELDTLVSCAKAAGAVGARLTGAGWGGCTVSLVHEADAEAFIEQVKREYYVAGAKKAKEGGAKGGGRVPLRDDFEPVNGSLQPTYGWDNVIFASRPGSGGAVLHLSAEDARRVQ